MPRSLSRATALAATTALLCAATSTALFASSHREAPFITEMPKVDGTDFYMFRSYGPNALPDSVTLIANYQPLQDAYGGPNYFTMDPNALYEIHVDNNGDTREDITFQFRFENTFRAASLPIGPLDDNDVPADIPIALTNVGPAGDASTVGPGVDDNAGLNVVENYRVTVVRGDRRSATIPTPATNPDVAPTEDGAEQLFRKPVDNIGNKTIPDYAAYANNHIFGIDIPGCEDNGRVFVGQRRDGFVVNLGEVFDRVNLDPLGPRNSAENIIADKNVTSIALELPVSCLQETVVSTEENPRTAEPVIGAWTTASLRQARALNPLPLAPGRPSESEDDPSVTAQDNEINTPAVEGGAWTQISRLGHPLVNEVIIGLNQKDQFNASEPASDLFQFGVFVTHPTLPALITALFPNVETPATPRDDLVSTFITGIRTPVNGVDTNFTQPQLVTNTNGVDRNEDGMIDESEALRLGGEILRLNTGFPSDPPPALAAQNDLGFLACDLYGFPNGRRPVDDVVDITLTVAEGALTDANPNGLQTCDVSGEAPVVVPGGIVNDGAQPNVNDYPADFPYLATPLPGSPNEAAQAAP